jgi:Ca-activated chloride channel family protein
MIELAPGWLIAWPWLLLALPLPLIAARLLPPARDGGGAALRVPFEKDLAPVAAGGRRARRMRLAFLPLLAWVALVVAAARPLELGEVVQPPQSGRDLLLAVDLSGSMGERDMRLGGYTVDRLTAVKAVLRDFLERRVGDRVALLVFGQRAYSVTPLTLDLGSVRQQLDDSVVGLAGRETAIGDAIGLAVKRLRERDESESDSPRAERVVILLTDGVNTAGALAPLKAAQLAKDAGVRVHTIGFGGDGEVTQFFGMQLPGMGPQIDERTLAAVAEQTGGRYFRARNTSELAGIYAEIDRIEPVARAGEVQRPRIERYPLPLAIAGALALLAFALRLRPKAVSA